MPLLDEVDDGDTLSVFPAIHFYIYSYCYTQGRNISDLTLNSSSSPASTLAEYDIGS